MFRPACKLAENALQIFLMYVALVFWAKLHNLLIDIRFSDDSTKDKPKREKDHPTLLFISDIKMTT